MFYLFAWLIFAQAQPAPATKAAAPQAAATKNAAPEAAATPATEPAATPPAEGAAPAAAEGAAPPAAEAAKEGESSSEAAEDPWYRKMLNYGLMGYMIEGGLFMWPILLLGVLAGGVIVERYRSLQMLKTDTSVLRNQVRELLQEDRVEEALELCDKAQGPVPAILSSGLRKYVVLRRLNYDSGRIEEQVVKAMDDYGVHVVAALERHLPILATVSSVAPMIGFLGTVQGMIVSFKDIVATMGEVNIVEAAAAGIEVALLTTCFGLIVGIPAFMSFNYFTSVINEFVLELEESSTELIEDVSLQMALENRESVQPEAVSVT